MNPGQITNPKISPSSHQHPLLWCLDALSSPFRDCIMCTAAGKPEASAAVSSSSTMQKSLLLLPSKPAVRCRREEVSYYEWISQSHFYSLWIIIKTATPRVCSWQQDDTGISPRFLVPWQTPQRWPTDTLCYWNTWQACWLWKAK